LANYLQACRDCNAGILKNRERGAAKAWQPAGMNPARLLFSEFPEHNQQSFKALLQRPPNPKI
jgi:hypothetical protein